MRIFYLFFFLFAGTLSAFAENAPASVFFTPEESRQASMLAAKETPAGQGDIRLGAILYYAPNDWTLWVRGERWTPDSTSEDLRILSVTPNEVVVAWREDKDSEQKEITLKPNQMYQISTGKIISSP